MITPVQSFWRDVRSNGLRHDLIVGTGGSLLLKGINILLVFGVGVVLARILEPSGYGVYSYALSVVTLLAIPVQMGLPTLVVRNVAAYQAREEWGLLRGVVLWASRVVSALSLVVIGGVALYLWLSQQAFQTTELWTFAWASLLVPFIALGNLRGATLRGLREVLKGQLPEMILRPGLQLILVGGAYWLLHMKVGTTQAMQAYVVAAVASFLVGGWLLGRRLPVEARTATADYDKPAWIRSVVPFSFLAAAQVVNHQTDIIMLGLLRSSTDVGVYRVAVQGASLVPFGLAAVNVTLGPHMARLYALKDHRRLNQAVRRGARMSAATGVLVTSVLIVGGQHILREVFGEAYINAGMPLILLSLGQLVNAAAGPVGSLLKMTGREKDTAVGFAISALVNVVLNLVLIPPYGATGAAIATATSLGTWNVLLLAKVTRCMGIRVW